MAGGEGIFGSLADKADRFVQQRLDHLATLARAKADQLAEQAGEHFARQLVDQISQRLAARIALMTAAASALVAGIWLLVSGLSGALGELLGREWFGQLVAGAFTLLVVVVVGVVIRMRRRWRKARAEAEAKQAAEEAARANVASAADVASELGLQAMQASGALLRNHPVASAAAVTAVGVLAGTLLSRSNGRSPPQA